MHNYVYLLIVPAVIALVVGCPTTTPVDATGNENESTTAEMSDGNDTGNDNESSMTDMSDRSLTGDATGGAALFDTSCAFCHADDATGNIGPNIQDSDVPVITDHVINAHEGHTAFDLSTQDIADIQSYLASL